MQKLIPTESVQSDNAYDDERIFEKEWLPKDCDWIAAEIDRYHGLTLVYEKQGQAYGVHFARSLCGYYGSGPTATAKILSQAGFGDYDELLAKVSDPSNGFIVLAR